MVDTLIKSNIMLALLLTAEAGDLRYYQIYRTKVRIIRQTAENSGANCSLYTKNARIYRVVVLFFSLFIVSYY